MCGIAGKVDFGGGPVDPRWLHAACDLVSHRGPDGERSMVEGGAGHPSVAFGHRRLKVIDLRPAADQPMRTAGCSICGPTAMIVFNGEIYNYRELRRELESRGHRFATDSDTEVILHLYEERGANCVHALRGMFAFALWDSRRQQALLARDRVGKKPLYYRFDGTRLWFASEPRAILADSGVPADVDAQAIRTYLSLGYVSGDSSAFAGLQRLPPAHRALVNSSGVHVERYWTLQYQPKLQLTEPEAIDRVRASLAESVRLRLISDVPLGAFLSGGVDSSAVVALMCREGSGRVKTFSIGFEDERFNELAHARSVAARLDTDHHEFVVSPDLDDVLPRLAWHYGEPYADSSAVPTFHLARLARQHITVALTGDGGDESFAGYRRYVAERLMRRFSGIPGRRLVTSALGLMPSASESRSRLYDVRRFLAALNQPAARRYASYFGFFDPDASLFAPEFAAATSGARALAPIADVLRSCRHLDPADAAMAADVSAYLPDDLLMKVDVATMAVGLEARSPLLDHHVMELAARLPANMKLRGRTTKALFKKALHGLVPEEILSRPKMGFAIPLDGWLRTRLKDMTYDVLLSRTARERGYVRPDAVERLVSDHMAGRGSHGHRIWALLMLELWHQCSLAPAAARSRVPFDRFTIESNETRSAAPARLPLVPIAVPPGSAR
jgi:asparagine synthase (glutamine-hydrolysing)